MSSSHRPVPGRIGFGAAALLGLLATSQPAGAAPWNRIAPSGQPTYDYDRRAYGPAAPQDPRGYGDGDLRSERAQRCNVGRLVGGIVGGGLGYAVSRDDGRSWAVPLGALLGQQMGCSIGAGRDPLPW